MIEKLQKNYISPNFFKDEGEKIIEWKILYLFHLFIEKR